MSQGLDILEDFGIGIPAAAPPRADPEDENYYTRPDPETGKLRRFPRVTKFVKHGGDTFALDKWHDRFTAIGVARHEDLQVMLANLDPEDDKARVDELVKIAQDRMAARSGAMLGTAVHYVTELKDAGKEYVAKEWLERDLQAYDEVISAAGFEIVRQWRERTLCVKRDAQGRTVGEFGLCGTVDAFMRHTGTGRLHAWDLKTGRSLKYAIGEVKPQLACYSRAGWVWVKDGLPTTSPHGGHWEPAPEVDQEVGYVLALRPGTGVATAIKVDISDRIDFSTDPPQIGGWALALDADRRRRTVNAHRRKVVTGWEPIVTVDLTQGEITYHNP